MNHLKTCSQCGKIIQGRQDKKFCDDQCRSIFHNHANSDITSVMRNINYILRKNRRILAAILPKAGKTRISSLELKLMGYELGFFTHQYTSPKGEIFKVCYDYGFLNLDEEQFLLVHLDMKRPDRMRSNIIPFHAPKDEYLELPAENVGCF